MSAININFDEQPFQIDAINAVADIFDGQYPADSQKLLTLQARLAGAGTLLEHERQDFTIRGNSLQISDALLIRNLREIQERNGIEVPPLSQTHKHGYNYTVEMETGTGKTYVYVRTALELARRYGWRKFMIIVPSIAIKEGVYNAIATMRPHLESLYDDIGYFNVDIYDSKNVGKIGDYARSDDIELMIATIDSFNKDSNIFNRPSEKIGYQVPKEVIQDVRPIVIIDEPQSKMSGVKAKEALRTLNALFTLRYSATHRQGEYYNLMYQLGPVEAHQQNLVKTVYVRSAGLDGATSKPYIRLLDVRTRPSGGPQAKLEFYKRVEGKVKKHAQWLNPGDLEIFSDNDTYRGYVIDNISARDGAEYISFEGNSDDLHIGEMIGGFDDTVMQAQIRATITAHLDKERNLAEQGIKVLSLFFVDRVASYWDTDEGGNYVPGKIQKWFVDELHRQLALPRYTSLYERFKFDQLFDAYFSEVRKKKSGSRQIIDETTASSGDYKVAEAEAFERIMRDKQSLLDINKPLRFIFSHSALKEGWDNPNVFQICMMRDSNSPLDRRQTIGRGLRLPVDQNGNRCFDKTVNQLTVVANESYEEFAANLQHEYSQEGTVFGRIRTNAFAAITSLTGQQPLGFEASKSIWQSLVDNGMLSANGELTTSFEPKRMDFKLGLPNEFTPYEDDIKSVMLDYELKNIIKKDEPKTIHYNQSILQNSDFNALWDRINCRTTYRVAFDTDKLIQSAAEMVANIDPVVPVRIVMTEGHMQYTRGGIEGQDTSGKRTVSVVDVVNVPDIVSFLQRETNLTRHTLAQILIRSGRLNELLINPTDFKFAALQQIRKAAQAIQVKSISYTLIPGEIMSYRKLQELLSEDATAQLDRLYAVTNLDKTISDHIPTDSGVEKGFAKKLDEHPQVLMFMKLPGDYKIPTPFGTYNPDWAYVYDDNGERKLYLVRETKHTTDMQELQRDTERAKISSARAHYETLNVDYEIANESSPVYDNRPRQYRLNQNSSIIE